MIDIKAIQTLELPKILQTLSKHTSFGASADLAHNLMPSTDLEEVRIWQRETAEARELIENKTNLSMGGVRDVRDAVIHAQRGVLIEANVLLDIRYTLRRATTIKRTLSHLKAQYPLLAELVEEIETCSDLQTSIAKSIDDNGEVLDTASTRLAIIRRDLKTAFDRLQSKLNRMVNSKRNRPMLQEALVTTRGGRYVIPIKAEFKGQIPGVVHDSSSSGATLFIEPLETVEMNNRWRELQLEEQKEIRRILLELTDLVAADSEYIMRTVDVLSYIDFTFAKARFAEDMGAIQPKIVAFRNTDSQHPGSTIHLKGARHPLLKDKVVPISVNYDKETWCLVVTGPNTGGKTVSLKTVGLLSLMAQCGLQLPADEAQLSVFDGIWADIGDEQSIEQSLSTFSSHMTNIINILEHCDDRSLVILDEVGAGTDPAEGSALARAILNFLVNRSVTAMVSTHHPELKNYAVKTPGTRNASMEFDLETLSPTYRLVVGLPGRSNALAIAMRLGLPDAVINDARTMVGTEELLADELLDELQRTRLTIKEELADAEEIREAAEEEREALLARLDAIEDERRDVIHAARRNAEAELDAFRKELRRLRNDMRSAGLPLEQLEALQATAEKLIEYTQSPLDEDEIERPDSDWVPKLGDTVFLDTLNTEGNIVELDRKEALVQVGTLRVRAKFTDMRKRNRSERRSAEHERKTSYQSSDPLPPPVESPGLELDLRGLRVDAAVEKVDYYVDAAYTSGLPFGRIIHGKGTGKLRAAVREFLHQHPLVSKVTEAHPNEGGSGVTIIHMVPTS